MPTTQRQVIRTMGFLDRPKPRELPAFIKGYEAFARAVPIKFAKMPSRVHKFYHQKKIMSIVAGLESVDSALDWCRLTELQNLGIDPVVVIETLVSSVLSQVTEGNIVLDTPAFRGKMHEAFVRIGTSGDEPWFEHLASCFSLLACRNLNPKGQSSLGGLVELGIVEDSGREDPDLRDLEQGGPDTTLEEPLGLFLHSKSAVFIRALDAHEQKEHVIEVASRMNAKLVLEYAIRNKTDSAMTYFDENEFIGNGTSKEFDFTAFSLNIIAIANTDMRNAKVTETKAKAAAACVRVMHKVIKGWF
jgi:hypothetical protein